MTDKTGDLLNKLTSTDSPEDLDLYLEQIRDKYPKDLSSYIKTILSEKGMNTADMQKKSGIDRTYIYQIMDGSRNPGRDKIIAIAIACEMTLAECQRALEIAQEGILYTKIISELAVAPEVLGNIVLNEVHIPGSGTLAVDLAVS